MKKITLTLLTLISGELFLTAAVPPEFHKPAPDIDDDKEMFISTVSAFQEVDPIIALPSEMKQKILPQLEQLFTGSPSKLNPQDMLFYIQSRDITDLTPLMLQLLVKAGADISKADQYGDTPLAQAIAEGEADVVSSLIQAGVNPNTQDKYGNTPLMMAAGMGNEKMTQLLLGAGAMVNMQNKDGKTPLMMAAFRNRKQIVPLLLKAGAKVNMQDKNGATALMMAAYQRNNPILDQLLEAGADSNLVDTKGKTYRYYLKQ